MRCGVKSNWILGGRLSWVQRLQSDNAKLVQDASRQISAAMNMQLPRICILYKLEAHWEACWNFQGFQEVLSTWLEVAAPSYEINMSGIIKTSTIVHLSANSSRYKVSRGNYPHRLSSFINRCWAIENKFAKECEVWFTYLKCTFGWEILQTETVVPKGQISCPFILKSGCQFCRTSWWDFFGFG